MATKCDYSWHGTGRQVFYDPATYETLHANYPISFYDDFLGYSLQKYVANENTTSPWRTVETALNAEIALKADEINGVVNLIVDSDDNAEVAVLHWGDQESLSIERGVIFEARVAFSVLPTTGTETVQAVWGLAGAHNTTPDTIDCNAWFRLESADQTMLLWETDDNIVNDDDNATSPNQILTAGTIAAQGRIYMIDCTDPRAVRFYVDGVQVGTGDMGGLTSAVGNVQPYFNVSKAKSSTNTGTCTMLIDYVKVWQDRS
jgi:hypothetical protein